MKTLRLCGILLSALLLSGCQNMLKTMVAHITISDEETASLAKKNAAVNYCLSRQLLNKQNAYEFANIATNYLDLVVFDKDFYKNTYENAYAEIDVQMKREPGGAPSGCKFVEEKVPEMTANLTANYRSYQRELGVARSQENRELAQMMSNFRMPSTPMPAMAAPAGPFSTQPSRPQNILIHTPNGGMTNCRVTSSNFVFCL